jgi:DNA-binding response OmpR family regulator
LPFIVLGPANPADHAIAALRQGADDYVRRPIGAGELVARMEALLRRVALVKGQPMPTKIEEALVLERGGCSARIGPRHVALTPAEFRVLELMQQRRGQTISRQELSTIVWGHRPARARTNLSLFILHLRRKIETNPAYPQVIVTRWGAGYTLAGADLSGAAMTAS